MFGSILKSVFGSGGNFVEAVQNVALEYIQTDKETAEAKTLMIKTLDPNGMMRRQLAKFASQMYRFYLVATVFLIFAYAFIGMGGEVVEATTQASNIKEPIAEAVAAMTELFIPITASWGTIVSASFGVNYANVKAGK